MGVAELVIISAIGIVILLFLLFTVGFTTQQSVAFTPDRLHLGAVADDELQSYLPNQKINAIKRYRDLTGAGLKEAKEAIEYVIANPDALEKSKSAKLSHTGGAGVQDLIAEGRIDEAIKVYAAFMGVDQFTAREAVEALIDQSNRENRLVDRYDNDTYSDDDELNFRSMGSEQ